VSIPIQVFRNNERDQGAGRYASIFSFLSERGLLLVG
jgi:hypothetical protein